MAQPGQDTTRLGVLFIQGLTAARDPNSPDRLVRQRYIVYVMVFSSALTLRGKVTKQDTNKFLLSFIKTGRKG